MSSSGPEGTTRAITVPTGSKRRKPVIIELLARRELPVFGEGIGELLDDRTFDAEMRVAHGMGGIFGSDVFRSGY